MPLTPIRPDALFLDDNNNLVYLPPGQPAAGVAIFTTVDSSTAKLTATPTELNRVCDASLRIVDTSASATLTVTEALHDEKTISLNRAAGVTVTLPAATGSGDRFRFVVQTTTTSGGYIINAAGTDKFFGTAVVAQDAGDTVVDFEAVSTSNQINMNGTTTGGIKGDRIDLEDLASEIWIVRIQSQATGTEASPFAAQ